MNNYFYELPDEIQDIINNYKYHKIHKEKFHHVKLELNNVFSNLLKIENIIYKLYTDVIENYGIAVIDYYDEYVLIDRKKRITHDICDIYCFNKKVKKIFMNLSLDNNFNKNNNFNKIIQYLLINNMIYVDNIDEYSNELLDEIIYLTTFVDAMN